MINNEWDILDLYFKNHKYPFTGHHLDSYRNFIKIKIPEIIKSNNPITMIKMQDNNSLIVKIDIYIGGLNGDEIYVDRPISFENGTPKLLTPNDARMRNLTYQTNIFCKILVRITNDKGIIKDNIFENIAIASIPIMLHSDICLLKNNGSDILKLLGECPYDTGGYFIIDGKEKVIIAQEDIVTNKLFTSVLKEDDPNGFSYKGIIRSVADKGSVKPYNIEFFYVNTPIKSEGIYNDEKVKITYSSKKYNYGSILVSVPSIREKIPLFILFRALGIESDKDICNTIFGEYGNNIEKDYFENFIRPSIISASYIDEKNNENFIYTQNDALNYLYNKYKILYKTATIEHIKSIIITEIFPNIDDIEDKGKYLGYLIFQFIKTIIGTLPLSDRDSYIYKRVDISGFKLTELFQESYIELRDNIRIKIDREYYYGSFKDKNDYDKIINHNNIFKIIDSLIITESFYK